VGDDGWTRRWVWKLWVGPGVRVVWELSLWCWLVVVGAPGQWEGGAREREKKGRRRID